MFFNPALCPHSQCEWELLNYQVVIIQIYRPEYPSVLTCAVVNSIKPQATTMSLRNHQSHESGEFFPRLAALLSLSLLISNLAAQPSGSIIADYPTVTNEHLLSPGAEDWLMWQL